MLVRRLLVYAMTPAYASQRGHPLDGYLDQLGLVILTMRVMKVTVGSSFWYTPCTLLALVGIEVPLYKAENRC